jgi:hypothetical protein
MSVSHVPRCSSTQGQNAFSGPVIIMVITEVRMLDSWSVMVSEWRTAQGLSGRVEQVGPHCASCTPTKTARHFVA